MVAPNYGLEHLTYLMQMPYYRHVLLRRLPLHRFERTGTFWDKTPIFLRAPVPLVHTFNHLPMNGPPFILSFESELPFYLGPHRDWQHRLGYRLLAGSRCRALLSLSDTAGALARQKFTDMGLPEIAAKIQTFRGAVLPSRQQGQRSYGAEATPLRLIFVGADGLRKGIAPVLQAIPGFGPVVLLQSLAIARSLDSDGTACCWTGSASKKSIGVPKRSSGCFWA